MKPLEHGMKVVERVLKKASHKTVNEMQFGFIYNKGTIDAVSKFAAR